MASTVLDLAAVVLYLTAGLLLARRLFSEKDGAENKQHILWITAMAIVLHCVILYRGLAPQDQWHLGLTNAFSFVACTVSIVFTVLACQRPIAILGIVVLPLAALSIIATWIWPAGSLATVAPSARFSFHLLVSLAAYAFLSLAVVQAVLLNVQEKRLHERHPDRLLKALPPIQTMEGVLFLLTGIGFALLTLTLVSGALYTRALMGVPLAFNHHTVLSILAWLIFGTLLVGHIRFGWRGRHAARWTIAGFLVLVLAYFGTKYVVEYLLA